MTTDTDETTLSDYVDDNASNSDDVEGVTPDENAETIAELVDTVTELTERLITVTDAITASVDEEHNTDEPTDSDDSGPTHTDVRGYY